MVDYPAPLPEELTLPALLKTATQLAIDFAQANPSVDAAFLNMSVQKEVRELFREEGGESAYGLLRMGALFSLRRNKLGRGLSDLMEEWNP